MYILKATVLGHSLQVDLAVNSLVPERNTSTHFLLLFGSSCCRYLPAWQHPWGNAGAALYWRILRGYLYPVFAPVM